MCVKCTLYENPSQVLCGVRCRKHKIVLNSIYTPVVLILMMLECVFRDISLPYYQVKGTIICDVMAVSEAH